MNPECERFVPLIVTSVDGALAPDRRAELDAHAASCAQCREALRDQAAVKRLLGDVDLDPAPPGFAARVRARVEPQSSVFDLLNWRRWALRLAPLAALFALAAWYPAANTSGRNGAGQTVDVIIDEWAGTQAQVAGGALGIGPNASADPNALLAAALGEASR